ncbi:MAG: MFS transporter [Chloroflexi bacterium RBG_13_54_9]|nr:MAG: MFS transporter [Chloroflexi bacterium RBG_13_54_9]
MTDISSEMTITTLPLFLANVLKVQTPVIGLIEGIAESTATLLKLISGWLSDKLGRRKALTVTGYSLSALAKPFLYLANAWPVVLGLRFTDRVGKGIRTSPRDALVADSTPLNEMGKSFGLHRTLDTFGAVIGLGLAALIVFFLQRANLELTRHTYQTLVLVAAVPAILAVLLIIALVNEPRRAAADARSVEASRPASPTPFSKRFKLFLAIMVIFTLGNSSDAFLILRAQNLGSSVLHVLIILVLFNAVYSVVSLPAGLLSDRFGRRGAIAIGWSIYALIYLGFAIASARWQVWLLYVLYGLYYGATEGVAKAFVADLIPANRRGTGYGLYNGAVGVTVLPASVIAGWLWQAFSPAAPFYFGAALAGIAGFGLIALLRE